MAEEKQPVSLVEGATTGDIDDELPPSSAAKSGEDRRAAAALANLDSQGSQDDDATKGGRGVDQEGLSRAMDKLGKSTSTGAAAASGSQGSAKANLKKVKIDATDVTLLIDQLDLSKPKATELLKQHEGDAIKAMRAFIAAN